MSKHLSIVYDGITLYDGVVGRISWAESANGTVEVKADPPRAGFREQLQAKKQQREALAPSPQLAAGTFPNGSTGD